MPVGEADVAAGQGEPQEGAGLPQLRLTRSPGGRAVVLAALAGTTLGAAHPPLGLWPVTFLTAPLLVAALRSARPERSGSPWARTEVVALALGTLAGLVAYGPMIRWLIPPAGAVGWGLLVGVQALWLGITAAMLRPWVRSPWLPVVGALTWVGMDAWRSLVPLSGFGWGSIAYAHADDRWLLPIARTVGAHGITLVVVALSLVVLTSIDALRPQAAGPRTPPSARRRPVATRALAPALGGAVLGLSATALGAVPLPPESGSLDVLVVQPNDIRHWIAQAPDPPLAITTNARDLTLAAVRDGGRPDLTVWPESSIDRDPATARGAPLGALARESSTAAGTIVAGAALEGPDPTRDRLIVALSLGPEGETDRYVKRRLVPFGEYVPGRRLIGGLPVLAQVPRDALPGPGPRALEIADGVVAAVVICFETLYPDIVRTNVLAGPEPASIVLAITNDASFQDGAEPAQHLAQSRLRAVETGRWVVHGALSGSSAFVDPQGGVHDATALFEATTIRRDVPLVSGRTPFLVVGDVVAVTGRVGFVAFGLAAIVGVRRRRRAGTAMT